MKFFDVRDQLNRQILAQDIRGFQATLKHIHGLHRRFAKPAPEFCAAFSPAIIMHSTIPPNYQCGTALRVPC